MTNNNWQAYITSNSIKRDPLTELVNIPNAINLYNPNISLIYIKNYNLYIDIEFRNSSGHRIAPNRLNIVIRIYHIEQVASNETWLRYNLKLNGSYC